MARRRDNPSTPTAQEPDEGAQEPDEGAQEPDEASTDETPGAGVDSAAKQRHNALMRPGLR